MPARVCTFMQDMHFPSIAAASRHFKVHPSVVSRALETGMENNVGKGANWDRKCAVWLDSVPFESIAALSHASGMAHSSIRTYIRRAKKQGLVAAPSPCGLITWTPPKEKKDGNNENN